MEWETVFHEKKERKVRDQLMLCAAMMLLMWATVDASGPVFCGTCANGGIAPMLNTHLDLACESPGATIDQILFASYGTPSGSCPSFSDGACNAATSLSVVSAECLHTASCRIFPNLTTFGDPCYGTPKIIAVALTCSAGAGVAVCGTSLQPLYEPYLPLNNLAPSGPVEPLSPDPLQPVRWLPSANQSVLQMYQLFPVAAWASSSTAAGVFGNISSLVTNATAHVTVQPALAGATGAMLIIDFGVENAAWLEIQSPDLVLDNVPGLQLAISEYNEPGMYNTGPKIATPVVYDGGWYRLELNPELYEGVRFGFVILTQSGGAPFTITQARIGCQIKPQQYNGFFHSDGDDLLTKIWWTAAYTVKLNLLADSFGSILIDRGDRISWTGDAFTSQAAALVAFANYDFIKNNIDRTSCSTCSNGIESYALYWIFSLIDYSEYTGGSVGEAALNQYLSNVDARLMHAAAIAFRTPNLAFMGSDDRVGADFEWPSADEPQRVYAMLTIQCLRKWAATLTSCASCPKSSVPTYLSLAANLTAEARAAGPTWHEPYGLHAVAAAVLANVVTPDEMPVLFAREFSSPVQICSFSPFNMYFILQALHGLNQSDAAFDAIRRCWGGVISLGGTTFWETFSQEWQRFLSPNDAIPNGQTGYTSMCHPWAAGVAKFLTENYLGVKPMQPGFATFQWRPRVWGVRGTAATPFGGIDVSTAQINHTHATVHILVPPGTLLADIAWPSPIAGIMSNDGFRQNVDLPLDSGVYDFLVELQQDVRSAEPEVPAITTPPPADLYPVVFLGRDNATQGSWQGTYGRDGYLLYSFGQVGQTEEKLPSYISFCGLPKVASLSTREFVALATGTTDPRALQAPSGASSGRALGCHATSDPTACLQTFVVDILFTPSTATPAYNLSFYFVDTDRINLRQVIEVRDATKFELVAPTQMLADFGEGAYLTYAVNMSLRVRFDQLRNGDAVVSGIFFN